MASGLWSCGQRTSQTANNAGERRCSELHSGARGFRADALRDLDYHRFSDDYIFDHQVLSSLLDKGARIGERKVRCAYDDTVHGGESLRSHQGCPACPWPENRQQVTHVANKEQAIQDVPLQLC